MDKTPFPQRLHGLCLFYGVPDAEGVILAQAEQIERLQEKLRRVEPAPIPGAPAYPVREG